MSDEVETGPLKAATATKVAMGLLNGNRKLPGLRLLIQTYAPALPGSIAESPNGQAIKHA